MRIKGIKIHISPILLGGVILLLILFIVTTIITGKTSFIIWGIPLCIILLLLPILSTYKLGGEYKKLSPDYENLAVPYRLSDINQSLQGHAVKIEGTVKNARNIWMGRPRYTISDGITSIIVFRSLPLDEPVAIGENVSVLGMVVKKYAANGGMSVHAVDVKKISELTDINSIPKMSEKEGKEDIKIKKFN